MAKARSIKDYIILYLKGFGMGSADVVPGVSGGTVAFIAGIYEELVGSISNINFKAFSVLRTEGISAFWKHVNGNFFVVLLAGIATAILSFAKIITHLIDTQPVLIWSFFFGLVFTSIYFVAKRVKHWKTNRYISFAIGAAIAYYITILPAQPESGALWYIFICGMIAICAMILPGISGSFILLLMGSYSIVLNSLHELNFPIIITFAMGALIGILSFSHVLKWMFAHYHDVTIALLSGFLLGSLNKIWPWKEVTKGFVKEDGEVIALEERNILPGVYEQITGLSPQTLFALLLFVVGAVLIIALEMFSANKPEEVIEEEQA